MKTIGDMAHGRDNNFNLLRIVAAASVMVSHSWPMVFGDTQPEPLLLATGYTLGTCAVFVFFAISGFFITKSFDRRKSFADFSSARILRLFPALIVLLTVTVLILGPIFTTLPIRTYFLQPETWTYLPRNLTLRYSQTGLPGLFGHNPYGDGINGSLWTLFYEVACYVMVAVLGQFGALRAHRFTLFLLLFCALQLYLHWGVSGYIQNKFSFLAIPFVAGMTCYVWRNRVPQSALLLAALAALAVVTHHSWVYHLVVPVALGYAALWVGLVTFPLARSYNGAGDYSYGLYIYGYPVQQAIVSLTGPINPYALFALALPITLVLAYLSWTLVESPALRHRASLAAAGAALTARLRRSRPSESTE